MIIKNITYYAILFTLSFVFSFSYYVYKEYNYRVEVRDGFVINPVINKVEYTVFEENKYIELNNKKETIVKQNDQLIYTNSDFLEEVLRPHIDKSIEIIDSNDYCIIDIKENSISVDSCSNMILSVKIKNILDGLNQDKHLSINDKNKKIKFYFK